MNDASPPGVDIFQVPLQGLMVECTSIEDAVAVKKADWILADRDGYACMPAELDRLAIILTTYGRQSAAENLKHRATRLRAAAYLKNSVGYETTNGIVGH